MILAAPLVIPFAEAIGLSVATLGIAKASDMVNEYIQENPEQSMKIFQMIMPAQGIANALKNKSSDEEVEEDVEVEEVDTRDLTRAEKAKMMKELAKSGGGNMREKMKKGYEEIIQPGESDRELDDAEDRYDGGVEDAPKPKFDYKKFFKKRYADGGAIGIEVLFEPKREKFNTGGTPYDARASAVDYATALDRVGAGTNEQKRKSLSDYLGNAISTQGQKIGNVGTMALQGAKGVLGIQGTPITNSMQTSLQNIIQNQIKNSGKLSGNINYNDYGVKTNTQGNEFLGFGDRSFTDPEAALATTLGQASYSVDPKTGKITFTGGTAYDFGDDQFGGLGKFISKGGAFNQLPSVSNKFQPGATEYNPDITLGSDFMKQFNQSDIDRFRSGVYAANQFDKATGDRLFGGRIEKMFNEYKQSPSTFFYAGDDTQNMYDRFNKYYADGGRVGLFMGGDPLTGQALQTYNSMKAYGFSDQEIADALSLQRASASNAETATAATAAPINVYNQIGGGGEKVDDDDDSNTNNAGLKGFDAIRTAGLFALNPVGYLASKALTGLYNNYKNPYTNVLGVTNAATKAAITREEARDLQDRIDRGDFGSNTPTPQDLGRTDKGGGKGSGSSDGSKGSRGGGMGGFGGGADRD